MSQFVENIDEGSIIGNRGSLLQRINRLCKVAEGRRKKRLEKELLETQEPCRMIWVSTEKEK